MKMDKKVEEVLKKNKEIRQSISVNAGLILNTVELAKKINNTTGLETHNDYKKNIETLENVQINLYHSLDENEKELKELRNNCQHEFEYDDENTLKCKKCGLVEWK